MTVTVEELGPSFTDAARTTLSNVATTLRNRPGAWTILANVCLDAPTDDYFDRLHLVVVGPTGVTVCEIRRGDRAFIEQNSEFLEVAALRAKQKAGRLQSVLGRADGIVHVRPVLVLASNDISGAPSQAVGVSVVSTKDLGTRIAQGEISLDATRVGQVVSIVRADHDRHPTTVNLGSARGLEVEDATGAPFHVTFRASHNSERRILVHLYDLTAGDRTDLYRVAQRGFEVLHDLAPNPYIPPIVERLAPHPAIDGDLAWFAVGEDRYPSIAANAADPDWNIVHRVRFAAQALTVLEALHKPVNAGIEGLVLRDINPTTLRVAFGNEPYFSRFRFARYVGRATIAPVAGPQWEPDAYTAPEVREGGLSVASAASDVYSICASLISILDIPRPDLTPESPLAPLAREVLQAGCARAEADRPEARHLALKLDSLFDDEAPEPWGGVHDDPSATLDYDFVRQLGGGGFGATWLVRELPDEDDPVPPADDESDCLVAKVPHTREHATRTIRGHRLARPVVDKPESLASVLHVAGPEWEPGKTAALITYIRGDTVKTASAALRARRPADATLVETCLTWYWRTLCSLTHLHPRLVHGDVSPENILQLDTPSANQIVLVDYDTVTAPNNVYRGTREQYASHQRRQGARASCTEDVFATAATIFGCLVGTEDPFKRRGRDNPRDGLAWPVIPSFDESLRTFTVLKACLDRATAPNEADRYLHAQAALDDLNARLADQDLAPRPGAGAHHDTLSLTHNTPFPTGDAPTRPAHSAIKRDPLHEPTIVRGGLPLAPPNPTMESFTDGWDRVVAHLSGARIEPPVGATPVTGARARGRPVRAPRPGQPHTATIMRRKLIETLFPVAAISAACAAEANRRSGHPSQLHPYWARRPLALARATILAQTLDDPQSQPERFPTPASQATERARLISLVERLAAWNPVDGDDAIVAEARAEIARHLADGVPPASTTPIAPFHDPFAGAGTFAIEAQRLGLDAHASDLNPLAALLSTVSVAFAPVFAHRLPVGNLERDRTTAPTAALRLDGTPLRGLAHDVVHYGAVLFHLAQRRLGHLYPDATLFEDSDPSRGSLPTRGTPVPVIAWIWARTIPSPNPAFAHVNVPLVTTFVLDARPAEAAHLAIDIDGDRWTPRVVSGPPKDRRAADLGTRLDRTTFRCVLSDTPITLDMIDAAAREGRLGTRLLAIVAAHVGGRHAYLAPDQTHAEAAARAVRPRDLPDLPIHAACARDRLASPRTYGLDTVGDLFTDRQALNASTLFDLIGEVRDLVQADAITAGHPAGVRFHAGGSDAVAYADAVATLLALAISRYLATGNALAQWQPNGARVLGAFARPGLAMAWNFAEVNPFVSRAVGLRRTFTQVADGLTSLPPGHGRAFLADARTATVPPGAIVTADPPYYDDIPYADLSDFFYPWLRRALRHIHPDLFATLAAPQADELIVNNRPGDGVHRAPAEYEQGLADVFRAVVAHAHPDVPVTCITTIRERVGAPNWSGQTTGPTLDFGCLAILARAGLQITALWPVRTHPPTLGRFVVPASAQTPALVVARRRATGTPTITLRAFINGATPAITKAVARLCDEGVPPSVILVAALGPGLEVATGAAAVVAPDGSHLDLDTVIARARDITLNALDPADDATNDPAWDRLLSALVSDAPWAQRNLSVADRLRAYAAGASLDDLDRLFRRILADIGNTPGAAETLRATLDAVADVADGRDGAPPQAFGPVARAVRTITYRAYARAVRLGDAAGAHAIDALVTAWPSVAGASHEAPSGDLTP